MSPLHEIRLLLRGRAALVVIDTVEEERALALVREAAGALDRPVFEWSVRGGLVAAAEPGAVNRTTAPPADMLEHVEDMRVAGVFLAKDLHHHLGDPVVLRQAREAVAACRARGASLVMTGTAVTLPPELAAEAARVTLALPGPEELAGAVAAVLEALAATAAVRVDLDPDGRPEVVRALRGLTLNQARQAVTSAVLEDGRLSADDVPRLREHRVRLIRDGGLLEYLPASDNTARLGGFARLRTWLARTRVGFTAEARALGVPAPRGIMLVGVPGCGKSLAARAVARAWGLPLLKLDAGRLLDKYVGESERNLRSAIATAESVAPCVLWIDEIEKTLVPSAGGEADAALGRRMFGSFLTWMQDKREDVFVVATANDLRLTPPELLRKGRFDEVFFVDLPDAAERADIWAIHLGLRRQDPAAHDVAALTAATDGFSGAEIEAAVVAGLYHALSRRTPLTTADLLGEVRATVPLSVSRAEEVAAIREAGRSRFTPVR